MGTIIKHTEEEITYQHLGVLVDGELFDALALGLALLAGVHVVALESLLGCSKIGCKELM